MATDASGGGWGASLQSRSERGQWSEEKKRQHINCLEMLAVEKALTRFQDRLSGKRVCIQIDNKTVVSYLSKGGGTRSLLLSRLARRILLWSQKQRISIQPVYVKGIVNTVADSLSRNKETQWHLSPAVTRTIFHKLGTPAVDLFASR